MKTRPFGPPEYGRQPTLMGKWRAELLSKIAKPEGEKTVVTQQFVLPVRKKGVNNPLTYPPLWSPSERIGRIVAHWIQRYKQSGGKEYAHYWDTPDLEFENYLLNHNPHVNRPRKEKRIKTLVSVKRRGGSMRKTHAIFINVLGQLENGQHRCISALVAKVPSDHDVQICEVGAGVDNNSAPDNTHDGQVRRGTQELWAIKGGAARLLLAFELGERSTKRLLEPDINDKLLFLERDPLFLEAAELAARTWTSRNEYLFYSCAALAAAFYLIFSRGGAVTSKIFVNGLVGGKRQKIGMKNITSARDRLGYLNLISAPSGRGSAKGREPRGDKINFQAIDSLINHYNSYPSIPDNDLSPISGHREIMRHV